MAKLGLVITDGVGFRNFILSGFLDKLSGVCDGIIIFSALPKQVFQGYLNSKCIVEELSDYRETGITWFFRKLKEIAHLKRNEHNNFGFQDNLALNYPNTKTRRGKLTRLIYKIANRFNSEANISFYNDLQIRSLSRTALSQQCMSLLEKYQPGLLFFTHQRPPYVAPLLYVAKKKEIATSSFIFSWDNLASKGRMAGDFDHYLVWSELMKTELLEIYSEVRDEQVKIVGTPQFEFYTLQEFSSSKSEFNKRFELNPEHKSICYSCGDISTSANDELYIKSIAEAILKGQIQEPVNFIVRTSPAEEPDRFKSLQKEFDFIRWNFPKWIQSRSDHSELWSQRVPSKEDMVDLRMLLEHSDLGINMCSTMSLDFMVFKKPVINPVFGNGENGLYNDQRFLKFAHYKRVVDSGAVATAKNKKELIKEINFSIAQPEARLQSQNHLLELQIGKPLKNTSRWIAKTLKKLAIQ